MHRRRHPRLNDDVGPMYRGIVGFLRPVMRLSTRIDWRGARNIPATGGFVVAPNHLSYIDPLILGDFLVQVGRAPRFLAKSPLFSSAVLGAVMKGTGQIPVYRETERAIDAYAAALLALRQDTEIGVEQDTRVLLAEATVTPVDLRAVQLHVRATLTSGAALELTTTAGGDRG